MKDAARFKRLLIYTDPDSALDLLAGMVGGVRADQRCGYEIQMVMTVRLATIIVKWGWIDIYNYLIESTGNVILYVAFSVVKTLYFAVLVVYLMQRYCKATRNSWLFGKLFVLMSWEK